VYVETERETTLAEVLDVLRDAPGVEFSGEAADYPTPLEVAGEQGTSVGRVRVDGNVIQYWCVADNLLKGAATNAVQIARDPCRRRPPRLDQSAVRMGVVHVRAAVRK
jgi:aspartate-semialdehyde dehydrogenase